MKKNNLVLAGAMMTGLLIGMSAPTQVQADHHVGKTKCYGVNSCKGHGACGGKGTSCAGTNSCKGKGWIQVTEKECKAKGGRLTEEATTDDKKKS